MSQLTIVIPVGPYHTGIVHEAIASVHAQTVPCELVVIEDNDGQGAGWTRNRGLEQVKTPFVSFLDADDILAPTFAALSLGILEHYTTSGRTDPRYVYTDWRGVGDVVVPAPDPCEAWTNGTYHIVTTVLPTDAARRIGGFDEQMQGVEDADFYVRLRLSGLCGIHVNAPLVQYRTGGRRSVAARANGHEARAKQYMTERYGGYSLMGCCGDSTPHPTTPENEPEDGDILAQALWHGNRKERGRITGRLYPRTSTPKLMYVNPADVAASPMLWRAVTAPVTASNGIVLQPQYTPVADWQSVVGALYGGGNTPTAPGTPIEYKPPVAGRSKAQTVKQAQEWTRVTEPLE